MYGLFKYTYDHYEWEEVLVISKNTIKLKKHYKNMGNKYPITESDDQHDLYSKGEILHYMIKKMEVI